MGILYQAADPIYWVIWLFVLFSLMAFNELGRVKLWCGHRPVRGRADCAHPLCVARQPPPPATSTAQAPGSTG